MRRLQKLSNVKTKVFFQILAALLEKLYFRLIFHNFQELLLNFSKNSHSLFVDSTDSERCKGTILLSTMWKKEETFVSYGPKY